MATPSAPVGGTPADPRTVELVTSTAREYFACFNAGDLARVFSLYSDHHLVTFWGGGSTASQSEIDELVAALANPTPMAEKKRFALVAVEDVRVLPDGRVSAVIRNNSGSSLAVFGKSGDRYLVDWAYELPDEGTPIP